MAFEINAQYVRFVQFAQQQDDAVNSKVIARVSDEGGALDGRAITEAKGDKVAPWTRRSIDNKNANNTARALFRQSIIDMFGGEDRIPASVKEAMLLKDYGRPDRPSGKPLTARRIMAVKAAVDEAIGRMMAAEQKAEFAKSAVAGEGELADKLRGLYMRFGGPEVFKPGDKLAVKRNNIILSRLNGSICEECKALAGPDIESTQFVKDLNRNETVKLPGNQMLDNHSLDGARDQLASFVTNGAKTTYASLGDVEKGKVRVLMAILNQKTVINVLLSGEPLALDPRGRDSMIQYAVAGKRRWEFAVAFKQDGTLSVTCKSVIDNLANMSINGENGEEEYYAEDIDPATKIETAFNVEISADEFNRLASLDYSKCDPEATDRLVADPNVKDPHAKYGEALGKEFAFKTGQSAVKCTSSWKITVA